MTTTTETPEIVDLGGPDGGRYWRVTTGQASDHPDAIAAAAHARATGSVGATYNGTTVERAPSPEPSTTVYVAEGWWHPNCKSGQVHDHPKEPKGSWSIANHRTCVEVYTKRKATTPGRPRIVIDADCPSCGWPERWAILPDLTEPGPVFGCPKCDYTSETRDA